MSLATYPSDDKNKNIRRVLAKSTILLVISTSLFWFSENFSPVKILEPQSTGWVLWFSYANDLILPFAFYFFICLGERWLKTWHVRALFAFVIPMILEFGQLFLRPIVVGHYNGSFDLLDLLMYAIGVGLAVIVEQFVFMKLFQFWQQ